MRSRLLLTGLILIIATGVDAQNTSPSGRTVAEAKVFVDSAEQRLRELWVRSSRASWVQNNFITDDTEALAADAQKDVTAASVAFAKGAARFDGVKLPYEIERKLKLLKL